MLEFNAHSKALRGYKLNPTKPPYGWSELNKLREGVAVGKMEGVT
jgi:hypothetical protein